jgi:hypothetical protein
MSALTVLSPGAALDSAEPAPPSTPIAAALVAHLARGGSVADAVSVVEQLERGEPGNPASPSKCVPLRTFASVAASVIYDAINVAETPDQLDDLARTMWRGYGEGAITDDDANVLQSCIDRRRPLPSNTPRTAPGRAIGELAGRVLSRSWSRQHPRSPDREASRCRRRVLGGFSAMPPNLRWHYTEGQRAVLTIIAGEIKHHGECDLPIDKIGALAGVCRTTVQTTLHEARLLSHITVAERPQIGRKSLTNIVQIISREWLVWIKRGPAAHRPTIGSNFTNASQRAGPDRARRVRNFEPDQDHNLRKYRTSDESGGLKGRGPPQTRWRMRA